MITLFNKTEGAEIVKTAFEKFYQIGLPFLGVILAGAIVYLLVAALVFKLQGKDHKVMAQFKNIGWAVGIAILIIIVAGSGSVIADWVKPTT